MRISEQGKDFIKSFEGCKLEAYHGAADRPGLYTIGYGHTGKVQKGQKITQAEADRLFSNDVAPIEKQLTADVTNVSQHQFDALVSFCFNLGVSAYMGSTLRRKLKAGDMLGAAAEFPKWCRANGKVVAGLQRRRDAERRLFLQAGAADIAALLLGMMMAGAAVLVAMIFVM